MFQWSANKLIITDNTIYNLNGYNSLFTLSYKLYTIAIVTYWQLFENITFYNNRWIDYLFVYENTNICVNYLQNLTLGLLFEGGFVIEEVDKKVFFLQGFFDFVEDIFVFGFDCVKMVAGSCV